jgi:hypothetical protein
MAPPAPDDQGRDQTDKGRRGTRWPRGFGVIVVSSAMLFGLAALLVGGAYLLLSGNLRTAAEATYQGSAQIMTPYGRVEGRVDAVTSKELQRRIASETLDRLRDFSFLLLGVLFVASLGISFVIARRASAAIARITKAARDVQASDLGGRILPHAPDDQPWRHGTGPTPP